jgi:hypothetical protein
LRTRHQARKNLPASRAEPVTMNPNSQTQPSMMASEPNKTRS